MGKEMGMRNESIEKKDSKRSTFVRKLQKETKK